MDTLSAEAVVTIILGLVSLLNEVLQVIPFLLRLTFVILFMLAVTDLCLRSAFTKNHFRQPSWRVVLSTGALVLIGLLFWTPMRRQYMAEHMPPSFVYVVPTVVLNADTWVMALRQYGPQPVYNVAGRFDDLDRLAWIRAHPKEPLSFEAIENAHKQFSIPEVDAESVSFPHFHVRPLNLDHEHFSMSISSREDSRSDQYSEMLSIERLKGKWLWKIAVKQLSSGNLIIDCQDAGFPAISSELGPCFPDFSIKHQGDARLPFQLPAKADDARMLVAVIIFAFLVLLPLYWMLAHWWIVRFA